MSLNHAVIFLLLLCSTSLIADHSVNLTCKADKRVVGACFKVHGRLSNWNGNPTQRIWIVGTKRMLGVRVDTDLPKALADKMGDFDDVAAGDFEVCPLTREQAGKMQIVCVASVFRRRRQQTEAVHAVVGEISQLHSEPGGGQPERV